MAETLLLVVGIVLLYLGAEGLVRGSASLALRLGMTPLVVGLTVVAFGTSSPELLVSLRAGLAGQGGVAAGNVVGSNICNLALILGLSALIRPIRVQTQLVRLDVPVMIGCSVLLVVLLLDGRLGRWEGALLTLGIVAYVAWSIYQGRRSPEPLEGAVFDLPVAPGSAWVDVVFAVGGLALLMLGAGWFVQGAVALAERIGISEAVIGLTVVAVGTSLPELATSVVAAFRHQADMAIGNVVGSNIFNILGILGPVALATPVEAVGIAWLDLGVMITVALLSLPFLWSGFRLNRWEGLFLLALYAAYTIQRLYVG